MKAIWIPALAALATGLFAAPAQAAGSYYKCFLDYLSAKAKCVQQDRSCLRETRRSFNACRTTARRPHRHFSPHGCIIRKPRPGGWRAGRALRIGGRKAGRNDGQ